jgi:hypothetical protein
MAAACPRLFGTSLQERDTVLNRSEAAPQDSPFVFFGRNNEVNPMPGAAQIPRQTAASSTQRASTPFTLFGEEPYFGSNVLLIFDTTRHLKDWLIGP